MTFKFIILVKRKGNQTKPKQYFARFEPRPLSRILQLSSRIFLFPKCWRIIKINKYKTFLIFSIHCVVWVTSKRSLSSDRATQYTIIIFPVFMHSHIRIIFYVVYKCIPQAGHEYWWKLSARWRKALAPSQSRCKLMRRLNYRSLWIIKAKWQNIKVPVMLDNFFGDNYQKNQPPSGKLNANTSAAHPK